VQALHGRAPLYSGLLVFRLDDEELTEAIEAGLEGGANGIVLFEGGSMSEEMWRAFRKAVGR
jgi:hypothetical protein